MAKEHWRKGPPQQAAETKELFSSALLNMRTDHKKRLLALRAKIDKLLDHIEELEKLA